MKRLALLLLLWPAVAWATPFHVVYGGASWTQFVLTYVAPDANPCTVEVSESNTYSPLVPDVDSTLFSGANLDNRPGSLTSGAHRTVVIGTRAVATAGDTKQYSRALQANTKHYWRVTCSGQVRTGTAKTMNIPNGFTRGEVLPLDPVTAGASFWPTVSTTDRTQRFTDPFSGALVQRLGLPSDTANSVAGAAQVGFYHSSAGFHRMCSDVLSVGGYYHCAMGLAGGNNSILYGIRPSDGNVLFLGELYFFGQSFGFQSGAQLCYTGASFRWDVTDPNVFYCALPDTNGKLVLGKFTYTGNDAAVSVGTLVSLTASNLTPDPNDLAAQFLSFAPTFDASKFNCGMVIVQQTYALVECYRGQQDSYGWIFIYNFANGLPIGSGGTGGVVAGLKMWEDPNSRFCALHTFEDQGHVAVASLSTQNLKGDGSGGVVLGAGPYKMTLGTNMPANATDITVAVSSTCPGGYPSCTNGDPVADVGAGEQWLLPLQAGDWLALSIGGTVEYVQVKTRNSATSLTITRDSTGNTPTHSIGDTIWALCGASPHGPGITQSLVEVHWKFLSAPTGNDATNYALRLSTNSSPHVVSRTFAAAPNGGLWISEAYEVVTGPLSDPTTWAKAPDETFTSSPAFAGKVGVADGNSYAKHQSFGQVATTGNEAAWFADVPNFSGGNVFQLGPSSSALVEAKVYKYTYDGIDASSYDGLNRRHLPTLAVAGQHPLQDISGPSSHLTASTNYTYCIALAAGECRGGGDTGGASSAGDIFINPGGTPDSPYCLGVDNGLSASNMCLGDAAMIGQGVPQWRYAAGVTAATNVRVLTRLFLSYFDVAKTSNPRILPDGSWIIYSPNQSGLQVPFLLKVPPQPTSDSKIRTGFLAAPIQVTPPAGQTAAVDFGYLEHGGATDFFCTSRSERCQTSATSLDQASPFKWVPSETLTPATCSPTCTIMVPAIPGRVAYWRAHYYSGASEVGVGPSGVILDGTPVTGR